MEDLQNKANPFIIISQTKICTKTVQNISNHMLGLVQIRSSSKPITADSFQGVCANYRHPDPRRVSTQSRSRQKRTIVDRSGPSRRSG